MEFIKAADVIYLDSFLKSIDSFPDPSIWNVLKVTSSEVKPGVFIMTFWFNDIVWFFVQADDTKNHIEVWYDEVKPKIRTFQGKPMADRFFFCYDQIPT